MTTRRYRICRHCASNKPADKFARGKPVCVACELMIQKALGARKTGGAEPVLRNATSTEPYVPPVWGR